jgi:hypothetical protein
MEMTPLDNPLTFTGVSLSSVVPLPNCPAMFQPQHTAPPFAVTAQEWKLPVAMALAPLVSPLKLPTWP